MALDHNNKANVYIAAFVLMFISVYLYEYIYFVLPKRCVKRRFWAFAKIVQRGYFENVERDVGQTSHKHWDGWG